MNEHHFMVGPLLVRIPSYVVDYEGYVEFVESYVDKNKLRFKKENSVHYIVDEKVKETTDGMESFMLQIFDEIYVELIEINTDSINNVLDMEFEEAINFYDDIIIKEYFYNIPYLKTLFLDDDAFNDVHKYLEDAKLEVRKEEFRRELEKEKDNTEGYIKELEVLFNKNGNLDSKYNVKADDWDGQKVIKIEQHLVSEDLKTALMLNAVQGSFRAETSYMLGNLRTMIQTVVDTNPTDRDIVYLIVNPENSELILYANYNGSDLFSEFKE